jgi:serine protease Do
VIIREDGYIVTNNHVISTESASSYYQITQATSIVVKLYNDSTEYTATVIGTDSYTDLAIIKIDAENLTAATL